MALSARWAARPWRSSKAGGAVLGISTGRGKTLSAPALGAGALAGAVPCLAAFNFKLPAAMRPQTGR